jgi:hypothetical protein
MISFRKGNNDDELLAAYSGIDAGTIKLQLRRPGNDWFYNPVICGIESVFDCDENTVIVWNDTEEGIRCTISMDKNSDVIKGVFSAAGKGCALLRLIWELPGEKEIFPFMPAFMYGSNEGGRSPNATYPMLKKNSGRFDRPWESEEWLVRADRSSHCFTSVIGSRLAYAVGGGDVSEYMNGDAAVKNGLGISVTEPVRLTYSIGYINSPYTYSTVTGRNYTAGPDGYADLDKGQVTTPIFIIVSESGDRAGTASMLLRKSYGVIHGTDRRGDDITGAVSDIGSALVKFGYFPEARNFLVVWDPSERINKRSRIFNTSWAGGLRAAYPLLAAGHLVGDGGFIKCAHSVLDNIACNSFSSGSGFINENYDFYRGEWNARGWWYGMLEKPGHSAYVNGQAAYFLLLSWKLEKEHGNDHYEWYDTARAVLDRIVSLQDEDGSFGYTYSESDGSILDRDGFCGCWFVPPLVLMYAVTGDAKYLGPAAAAMDHYRKHVRDYSVYGCPHDTFKSPDEEGILAWIEASRLLHESTKDPVYLDDLLTGLDYEFSWKFGYDVHSETEPLKSMKWSSTGGSVTSVNNSHIHPMGSSVLYDILYAWRMTDDGYLLSRLRDTLNWSLMSYVRYDGHYGWGKKGMINERSCHTDSLLTERFADGSPSSVWFCYHSWAAGSVLEGLTALLEKMDENEKKLLFDMEGAG